MSGRRRWAAGSHEASVERFYSRGVHGRTDIHRGYLNFGLWEDGVEEYVDAAENLVERVGKLAGLGPASRVLDVGCGFGTQDLHLQRCFGPLDLVGIDVTWSHVDGARRAAAAREEGRGCRFHHGSATELPFGDGAFTHVIGIEGPVHFRTRRRFFDEAFRVLRPGGVLVLADYALIREPRSPLERLVFGVARRLWRVPAQNVCTREAYRDQLVDAGFRGVRVDSYGPLTFPGYYREQQRPAFQREMERLQGRFVARVGRVINVTAHGAYRMGVVDYLLARGRKPGSLPPDGEGPLRER